MRDPASQAQQNAADPRGSTWLSANAGSGKTKVLIDRVARLLLSGVSPQHVLCLTYTKAAATEMQNRLFARLGAWAMMPEGDLRAALKDLDDMAELGTQTLAQARQLFARAIESPGGLRIQTIHSFCATLLRRFPLEAGVSPAFQEMDDRAARLMREAIIEDMAETTAPDVLREVAKYHTGSDFLGLMGAVAGHASGFIPALDEGKAKALFGVPGNETDEGVVAQALLGIEADVIAALVPLLQGGKPTDQKIATKLAAIDVETGSLDVLAQLEDIFLFGPTAKSPFGAKIDGIPTKDLRDSLPAALRAQLEAFMLRIEAARAPRIALQAAQKTAALHRFASVFLPLYDRAKSARGLLDFDDLITRSIALLTDHSVAAWVLFRLDGGIDHILVDEAQDTSPKQWQVVEKLVAEFTAGQGAADRARSLFVVGDKKQSIYSFQGADVAVFDEKYRQFNNSFGNANLPFEKMELQYSFRSSPAILTVVDNVFGARFPRAMGESVLHYAHKDTMPGRVDLWPLIASPEKLGAIDPTDTAAQISADSAARVLAEKVAETIRDILAAPTQIPTKDGVRAAHAGDILILVRRRSDIFHHIIRACKKLNLPIAGADRLRLGGEMAVRDITALLHVLATPEDDLSLAAALRSPLLGLTEGQLFDLAHGRKGYLWESLRNSPRHPEALAMLTDLRDSADYLRPYDLIERILTRHNGRHRLIAQLGAEAEEGIDEMLSQAMGYEQGEIPSLTGFLLWLDADDVMIKRQVDSAGQQIRVMTVHGAKGLEAPIVILPDTADRKPNDRSEIVTLDTGALAWRVNANGIPPIMAQARVRKAAADEDEDLRLLYVALTRAQSWLIVAAAGKADNPQSWYQLVKSGMQAAGAVAGDGGLQRYAFGDWPAAGGAAQPPAPNDANATLTLPNWALARAVAVPRPVQPFAPSRLSGAKTIGGDTEGDIGALAYGTAVHLLLENLPNIAQAGWAEFAARQCAAFPAALDEAAQVLTKPDLAYIFQGNLAEVPITAPLEKGQMLGVLDHLIVTDTQILAVDFKTNTAVPDDPADVPAGLLAQMGAYLAALEQIYPARQIDMAILWTKTATLMRLDHDMMREALRRAAIS